MTESGAGAAKTAKARVKPTHPPVGDMVIDAIKTLKERNGSSLIAIKKTMAATHNVDCDKLSTYIKRLLKTGVSTGKLVQTVVRNK